MSRVNFNDGKITQDILRTAFPMLIAQILNLLYSIIDRVYIGRIPDVGTEALGAVGLCFPIIILITGFTNMFGLGGSPIFSMALGRGDKKEAAEVENTAFRLLIVTALTITIIGELFGGPLLRLFGATGAELPMSLSYLRIYLIGTIFIMLATGMNAYINAQGYSVDGMISVTIGAAANLILDPIFIFAFGMGVQGAAAATVISQLLSVLYVLRFLFGNPFRRRSKTVSLRTSVPAAPEQTAADRTGPGSENTGTVLKDPEGLRAASAAGIPGPGARKNEFPITFAFSFPHAKEIISLGTAPFIMQCTNSLVSIACNNVLMSVGGSLYVSVYTIVSSVRSILDTPVMAITEGASPVLSFNYGARRPANVRKGIKVMLALTLPYTFVVWLLVMFVPEFFVRIFSSDAEIMADASRALHLYFFAFIFQSFQYAGQTVFKALGFKMHAIFFSLFRKVVLVVPLTFALPYLFGMGTDGVFIAEPVSNVIGGMACFITMLLTILPVLRRMEDGNPAA